jgi:acyl-CoA dehydrogenase
VISALLKYRTTDAMRDRVNDALDIHGGRAVQDGPSNYLFSGYMTTPVAITVEGANILTRTLITFAQGALRAHPYLYTEIAAAQNPDRKAGLAAFDTAFGGHVSFMLRNIVGSKLHALTLGRFASSPAGVAPEMAKWYRQLARYAQSFALVGDWTVAFLGGDLKRKQRLSGRMADILSDLYLLSAVLKRYEDEGRIKEDAPLVDAIARDHLYAIEQSFAGVFQNFPNPVLRWAMRVLVFPLGRHRKPASDRETYRFVRQVLRPGAFRDRLTMGTYVSMDPKDVTGVLEDAMVKVTNAEEIEAKFVRAIKKQIIERRLDRDAITDAVDKGVITEAEASILRLADQATDRVIKVDDFDFDELAAKQLSRREEAPAERAAE